MQWFRNFLPDTNVSLSDRGLAYGDGLFETLSVLHGDVVNLATHQTRLKRGCNRLNFSVDDHLWQKIWLFVGQKAQEYPDSGLKIILTRGSGGRGYLPPDTPNFEFILGVFEKPNYAAMHQVGVSLTTSPINASINRSLAGLKHLNRLENVMAKSCLPASYYEAVLVDANGFIIECIQSNLFWFYKGRLRTAALMTSGVQGSLRSRILAGFDGCIEIGRYTLEDLMLADEIFVCNAMSQIMPVVRFNDKTFPIGPMTKQLMEKINPI
ncbi:aminodeoxychorismate lyase [Marinomonas communis]|uniref:aminodeoxychorismate lyase n=1 Tax=Marinomonas communis TaxID=28254 RepID=UPI001D17D926|nr:aminodeoxychorismate lyase [Marinomonas communis]MCC4274631.1 aminodeoxychorismate lyase [Marinomonas communis]